MTCAPAPWRELEARLRPFVARHVAGADVDDVVQDVFVRMHRGLAGVRDDQRFDAWMFQVARSAIADHGRARARHPLVRDAAALAGAELAGADDAAALAAAPAGAMPAAPTSATPGGDDREAFRLLSACLAVFVARLPSPYREAVTLVELEGLTAREAAAAAGVSVSGMKSRVQRGRAQLRALIEACCEIALDARGKVTEVTPRPSCRLGQPACPATPGTDDRRS